MNILRILGLLLLTWLILTLSLYLYLYKRHPGASNEVAMFYLIGIISAYVYSLAAYMIIGLHFLKPPKQTKNRWLVILLVLSVFLCFFPSFDIVKKILPIGDFLICPSDGKEVPYTRFGPCEFYFGVLFELLLNTGLMILAVKLISRLRKRP